MTALPHVYSKSGNVGTITVFNADSDTPLYVADSSHPHWNDILRGVAEGDEGVFDLFDVAGGVMRKFQQVTDRVSWDGKNVLFDGDPIHSVLADQLSRAIKEGDSRNYTALAKFWEKLESNPNEHSREQAYDFLAAHSFQITEEGDVVGFKGVTDNEDGTYSSTARSRVPGKPSAYVNGVAQPEMSVVTQRVGDTVSMPRSEVTHDPSRSCERGLHVATRGYASGYGLVMEVHFNPRDIVSVPTIDRGEKVRVAKYTVARIALDSYSDRPVLRDEAEDAVWSDVGYAGY